jgi:hypothetical protein
MPTLSTLKMVTRICLFMLFLGMARRTTGQNLTVRYYVLIEKADSLYNSNDYENSALVYGQAFRSITGFGKMDDLYDAGRAWALAKNTDSSFSKYYLIAKDLKYNDYAGISSDPDLIVLHNDKRWVSLLQIIKKNKEIAESHLDTSLTIVLDKILIDDQSERLKMEQIRNSVGLDSNAMQAQRIALQKSDSINLATVVKILDKYGWLGSDIVGKRGAKAIFLIIQHANLAIQEKYLPEMQAAVKNGKASKTSLALLEDRVAVLEGRKQTFGSQLVIDTDTKLAYILPLEDPENVDLRRLSVGLQPMKLYVANWQIKWDVDQYKKDLPTIDSIAKLYRDAVIRSFRR